MSTIDEEDGRHRPRLLSEADYALVQSGFRELLPLTRSTEEHLRDLLTRVIDHPGSLVRAQLAFGIMRVHDVEPDHARAVAIAIEYFHTASLIFDDLPCMDDATTRRGQSCPHVVHGEHVAILGALALINRGYALLWEVLSGLPAAARLRASRLVTECLGVDGILNGQALDLQFGDGPGDAGQVLRVAEGKTVSLVRLTMLLPAVVAGVGGASLEQLDRLSRSWGLSYQITDDFKDRLMSRSETGKSTGMDRPRSRPNLPAAVGDHAALDRLAGLLEQSGVALGRLSCGSARWKQLESLQSILEDERCEIQARLTVATCA